MPAALLTDTWDTHLGVDRHIPDEIGQFKLQMKRQMRWKLLRTSTLLSSDTDPSTQAFWLVSAAEVKRDFLVMGYTHLPEQPGGSGGKPEGVCVRKRREPAEDTRQVPKKQCNTEKSLSFQKEKIYTLNMCYMPGLV